MSPARPARPDWLEQLTIALRDPVRMEQVVAIRPGVGARPAAVLVLIGEGLTEPSQGDDPLEPPKSTGHSQGDDPLEPPKSTGHSQGDDPLEPPKSTGPEILFVERPTTMRTHAGQIAFPGGAADPGDVDLADTALREAAEESGVDRSGVEVLGSLPPAHVDVSGFDVTAVVGWWFRRSAVSAIDPREAASVLVVPVSVLVDARNRARVYHPSGYTGPAFSVDDHLIWGLTAHLLDGVLDLAGWQQPWDQDRLIDIPARYLTSQPDRGGPDAH